MQQTEQTRDLGGTERARVGAVVERLTAQPREGETIAEVAHDARNMVAALGLYCDLIEEPGVLAVPFRHYGNELRLVASASQRLVEKLVALDTRDTLGFSSSHSLPLNLATLPVEAAPDRTGWLERTVTGRILSHRSQSDLSVPALNLASRSQSDRSQPALNQAARNSSWDMMPAVPIDSLAGELLANRNLLAAMAGPSIALTVDAKGGAKPVMLTGEDLTRILVNLVKNASEAMPGGGRIQISLRERTVELGAAQWLTLTIEDNGPGIPLSDPDRVFKSGYTTRSNCASANGSWPSAHRGLGLAITRSIVEAAGGRIHAANRSPVGARFEIELPVRML